MNSQASLIVTSIAGPGGVLASIAAQCIERSIRFIVIGDVSSPPNFKLEGCEFYSISDQQQLNFALASKLPTRHYARKNIGYLLAMSSGAPFIMETDDDNEPLSAFWNPHPELGRYPSVAGNGWVNVYRYFVDSLIWPRGFPLTYVQSSFFNDPPPASLAEVVCPIQQGLADANPDVDAIYRLLLPLPITFHGSSVALGSGSWCPFNSQGTVFFPRAFALLYLPSHCSFRMTDIWRSLVAQRICWANGWSVLFHGPTVIQHRNDHNLLVDFEQEISGYLHNDHIVNNLAGLSLPSGEEEIPANLFRCYERLVALNLLPQMELELLEAWIADVRSFHP